MLVFLHTISFSGWKYIFRGNANMIMPSLTTFKEQYISTPKLDSYVQPVILYDLTPATPSVCGGKRPQPRFPFQKNAPNFKRLYVNIS